MPRPNPTDLTPGPLRWREVDAYHCESDRGGYVVCRYQVSGSVIYEASHERASLGMDADRLDSRAMRAACQAHFDARVAAAPNPAPYIHESGDGQ